MRRLACPQCENIVTVEEGRRPVCDACGYGAPGPGEPGPPAAGSAKRRGKGMWIGMAAVVLLLPAALLAAWMLTGPDDVQRLGEEEAQERAEQALAALETDVQEGGDLRLVSGQMDLREDPSMTFGAASLAVELEWGQEGARRVMFSLEGGPGMRLEVYCTNEGKTTVVRELVLIARPPRDGCASILDEEPTGDTMRPGGRLEVLEDVVFQNATAHANGTVRAWFVSGQDTVVLDVDKDGRASRLAFEGPEGSGALRFTYGPLRVLDVPEASAREPLDVAIARERSGDRMTLSFSGGTADAPLDAFEARVMNGSDVVAAFPLEAPAAQGGISIEVTDADGLLGAGDVVVVDGLEPGWKVHVHDEWADRPIGTSALMPALPWPLLLLGLLGLARRRS